MADDPHRSDDTTTGADPDAEYDRPGYEDVSLGQAAERDAQLAEELVADTDDVTEAEQRFAEEATGAPALRDRPGGASESDESDESDDGRDPERLLELYLGDHLGGASGAIQVVGRSRDRNAGNQFGEFLADLHRQLEEERDSLERITRTLGARPTKWKAGLGTVAAALGSLKPSGHLVTYSPLSRVLEMESLMMAVEGKLQLWDTLRFVDAGSRGVSADELDRLTEQARTQLDRLRTLHREAVILAFTPG